MCRTTKVGGERNHKNKCRSLPFVEYQYIIEKKIDGLVETSLRIIKKYTYCRICFYDITDTWNAIGKKKKIQCIIS